MNQMSTRKNQADQIISFLSDHLGISESKIAVTSSLRRELGVAGDDGVDLMTVYARQFDVSIEGFDFDSHFGPEKPLSLIWLLKWFTGEEIGEDLIDLTVSDLVDAVHTGRLR